MDDKERARVTMLLEASIRKAEEQGTADEGTDLLRDMAEYTASDMTPEEATQAAPEDVMEEPVEGEEVPQEQEEQMETPPQSGGLMARG
jgi:hypothetical protein